MVSTADASRLVGVQDRSRQASGCGSKLGCIQFVMKFYLFPVATNVFKALFPLYDFIYLNLLTS